MAAVDAAILAQNRPERAVFYKPRTEVSQPLLLGPLWEDSLKRDTEIQCQVRLHIVMRQTTSCRA